MRKLEEILQIDEGWISLVADLPQKPKALIVVCHGLTGDRSGPQKILSRWAEQLCEHGYLVIRFDFRGAGDSSGDFTKTTFKQMEKDLEAVVEWSMAHFPQLRLFLAGLSIGGIAALMTAQKYKECGGIFLFSSDINDFPSYDIDRDILPIRNGQFYLHRSFFDARSNLFPQKLLSQLPSNKFLIYGQNDKKIKTIVRLGISHSSEKLRINSLPLLKTVEIENTGHLFESLLARSHAINAMISALEQLLKPIEAAEIRR